MFRNKGWINFPLTNPCCGRKLNEWNQVGGNSWTDPTDWLAGWCGWFAGWKAEKKSFSTFYHYYIRSLAEQTGWTDDDDEKDEKRATKKKRRIQLSRSNKIGKFME